MYSWPASKALPSSCFIFNLCKPYSHHYFPHSALFFYLSEEGKEKEKTLTLARSLPKPPFGGA